jgi:probable F420-dependent oxidoreductase
VEYHVTLPNAHPRGTVQSVVEVAEAAEELGFAGVWTTDHLLMPAGARYSRVLEPLVTLAFVAAKTSRVRLGTSVIVLPMRNPFVVAKQAATVDLVSGGRLTLGLGAGWSEPEFKNVGADFKTRGRRLDESIRLFRHLFSGSREPFRGEFYGYDDGVFDPLPAQGEHLPVLIGGNSEAALRRATRQGDLWQSTGLGPDDFRARAARLRRDLDGRTLELGARITLEGGLDEMRTQLEAWEGSGADHLLLSFASEPERWVQAMRQLSGEVLQAAG